MTKFQLHTTDTAPKASKPLLEKAQANYGFIPHLMGFLAEEPAALEGYMTLTDIFSKSSLNEQEQQIVLLTASVENNCTYCVAAHSTVAAMKGLDKTVIDAIRNKQPVKDADYEALRMITEAIVKERGWIKEDTCQQFLNAGYSRQHLLAVILGVTLKTLSNYTNHIVEAPLDSAFKQNAWEKCGCA